MLSFLDIQSLDDFWDWLPNHFTPMWYANQRGDSLQKFKVADGFRLVLRRGFADTECVHRFSGAIRNFADPFCYDRLSQCSSRECILGRDDNRRPFGIMANRSRYFFQSFDLPSGGYEGGYFQFFPLSDERKGREQVARLKRDRWMDSDAQWARLDFLLFNSDESLLIDFRMFLDIDPSGRVSPFVLMDLFRTTWYDFSKNEDIVRLVLELFTVFFWVMQIYDAVRDFLRCRARHSNLSRGEMWNRYRKSPYHSPIRDLQFLLFLFIFALWLAVIADPVRNGIVVNSLSIQSEGGKPLFTTQSGKLVRAYFLLNGFNCLLFSFRVLAASKMHPVIAELCTALGMQFPIFSWFATVLFIIMWLFSFQAIMLFGQNVVTCSDFGGALASTTQMSWSKVVNSRSFKSEYSTSVIAVSQRKGIGYLDLRAVAPTTAWLFYYPLFIVTWMFLMLGENLNDCPSFLCICNFRN
uniref:Polycystin domain-containing protein n=1 Tax=Cryptomonas curvata TaxID=233186 RepID=A0A7S0MB24_9CRYP|mmetsp:Transcript_32971/g.68933  ORF Transcript_32971/g.68933 Transcript_32971/m.68933 type:complete len:467 (+) Transcript_32971:672-2072(+)